MVIKKGSDSVAVSQGDQSGGMEREAEPYVTVIIPVLNAAETLGEQLEALALQETDVEWEVVVADNGSSDGSRDIAETWADKVSSLRVIDASARRGVSHARNVGAQVARGELLLVCDADDVVAPGWIAAMVRAARSSDVLGGSCETYTLNSPVVRGWRSIDFGSQLPIGASFLPYAIGCNFGCRREVFQAIGGWDESLLGGADDVDFSWRAQLAGYRLCFASDARIAYRLRADLASAWRQHLSYGRGAARLYRRYRRVGAKRRRLVRVMRSWIALGLRLPTLLSKTRRGRWVTTAAGNCGRLIGSIEQRVLYL